jgi:predicted amidohydrolase
MVVIRDGRVVAAGDVRMKLPADTQVIDATGKWVTPGIVAGFPGLVWPKSISAPTDPMIPRLVEARSAPRSTSRPE